MKRTFLALASFIFAATLAASASAQSSLFSFSGPNSFSSAPDRVIVGLGIPFPDDSRTIYNFGNPEDILIDYGHGFLIAASWVSGGVSSSSLPFLVYSIGLEHENNSVGAFRQANGSVFDTSGESTFTGLFFGLGFETPLGESSSSSSIIVPTFGAAINFGYGWAAVDGFGGSVQRDGSGIYGRADAYLAFPVFDGLLLSPGVSYRTFDYGTVEDSGFSAFLRLTIPL